MAHSAERMGRGAEGIAQSAMRLFQKPMAKFRFQDLEIWQLAIEITDTLFNIADELEKRRLYRFAEQLRGAGLSMSNNIAEGSGSSSKREFSQFLKIEKIHLRECQYPHYISEKKSHRRNRKE